MITSLVCGLCKGRKTVEEFDVNLFGRASFACKECGGFKATIKVDKRSPKEKELTTKYKQHIDELLKEESDKIKIIRAAAENSKAKEQRWRRQVAVILDHFKELLDLAVCERAMRYASEERDLAHYENYRSRAIRSLIAWHTLAEEWTERPKT